MTGCESAGGYAGCLDAFQEASLGQSGYSYLRHHLDAVNCPGVVYQEFRGTEQHLFRARIDWGADHFARFVLKQEP